MSTHRENVLLAVLAALTGTTPAGAQVFRSRAEAMARSELPAIVIKPGAESVEQLARGLQRINLDIKIEIHARGNPSDAAADPVIAAAYVAMCTDQTLGGRLSRMEYKGAEEPDFEDGDDTACRIVVNYNAIYITTTGDITKPAT